MILDDPEYGDLDPRDAAVLRRLDDDQRRTVLARRRLVSTLATTDPEQARAVAESTEMAYRLRRGFLTE